MKVYLYKNNIQIKSINPNPPKRTKVDVLCQQCIMWKSNITVICIDRSIKKRGKYICGHCACLNSRKQASLKAKETNLKRYGVTSHAKLQASKDKAIDNCIKKHGVSSTNKLDSVKKKKETTNLKRYGVKCVLNQKSIVEKIDHKKAHKKLVKVLESKYGVNNPSKLEFVKEKKKQTNLKNWGKAHYSQTNEGKANLREKALKRPGNGSPLRESLLKENNCKTYSDFCNKVANFIESNKIPPSDKASLNEFKTDGTTLIRALRSIDREDLVNSIKSSKENELFNFIASIYNGPIIRNDRKVLAPKELDIYLPELNIAFEFNGLYWHSEKYINKDHHYNKYKACLDLGIRLYTIWENVLDEKKDTLKLFIKNLIIPKERVFARKCSITKDVKRVKDFIKNNHLQGVANSHTYLGLEYQGALVMAISVSNHHRKGAKVQVLNRVCFSKYSVIGGLNKLLKLVEKPLITWSDNSYSPIGNMYKNAGFKVDESLRPDYFYTYGGYYLSKQSQAKKASKCPDNLTEHEWALKRGLLRVYDCGKIRWILK